MITETLLQIDPMFFCNLHYWMLLAGIIGIFLILVGFACLFEFYSSIAPALILILVGIMLFLGGAYGQVWANDQRPFTIIPANNWGTITTQNITSLSDGSTYSMNGHGSFFLGSGHVSLNGRTTTQYVFYKVMPDGYQIGTLDATNVFIREDENNYPYIEWDYTHTTAPLKRWDDNGDIDYTQNGAESSVLTKTIIHVPKGTVIKDYTLDSEV